MRVLFTAELVKKLNFAQRPKLVNGEVVVLDKEQGILLTEPTPENVREWTLRDAKQPGFGVRLTRNSKSYIVQRKRGSSTSDRWVLTEQHSLKAAQKQAGEWYAAMGRGDDPREEKRKKLRMRQAIKAMEAHTFGEAFAAYTDEKNTALLRPSSVKDRLLAQRWMQDTSLWKVPLVELSKQHVHEVFAPWFASAEKAQAKRLEGQHKRGAGPAGDLASCYKALRHCRAVWRRASKPKGDENPFKEWFEENSPALAEVEARQNTFSQQSLVKWLKALEHARSSRVHRISVVADFLVLVLLWGFRKREVMTLRWGTLDLESGYGSLPQLTTKKKRTRYFPLCPWATEILRQRMEKNSAAGFKVRPADFVFPSSAKEDAPILEYRGLSVLLKEQTGVAIGAHDLRRDVATHVFGETLDVNSVAMALGHKKKDVSIGYIQNVQATLRPLYLKRETRLRRLLGLEAEPTLTETQRAMLEAAKGLLKQAGLSMDDAAYS